MNSDPYPQYVVIVGRRMGDASERSFPKDMPERIMICNKPDIANDMAKQLAILGHDVGVYQFMGEFLPRREVFTRTVTDIKITGYTFNPP